MEWAIVAGCVVLPAIGIWFLPKMIDWVRGRK